MIARYFIDSGKSNDILDSDGVGIITVDNVALTGGAQVTDHIYRNENLKYTYTLAGSGETQSLFIQKDGSENKIIIRNWTTAKNHNITLQDQAIEEKPATLEGDLGTNMPHYKTLNKRSCKPISMRGAGLPLFSLNTQLTSKPASNNNEWRVVA